MEGRGPRAFLLGRRLLLTIALPSDAGEVEEFAAQQLRLYLGEILGLDVPVMGLKGLRGPHILLGEARHGAIQKALPGEALRYLLEPRIDVVAVHIEPSRVVLSGSNPRSVLFAVYRFLERHFGVRFFGPRRERVPWALEWALPPGTTVEAPAFKYRGHFVELNSLTLSPARLVELVDWLAKAGMNCVLVPARWWPALKSRLLRHIRRRGLTLFIGHHNLDVFLPPEKYFGAHPEYFAMVGGRRRKAISGGPPQICASSTGAKERLIHNLLKFLDENPEADWIGLAPNEGEGWCECPNCRRLGPPRESWLRPGRMAGTNQYIHLVEAVANELRRLHPGKVLALWAGGATLEPPFHKPRLPENVVVAPFRPEGRCYEHAIFDPSCSTGPPHVNALIREALVGWLHAVGRVCVFDFARRHEWRSLPKLMVGLIREELRFYFRAGVEGVFTSAEWEDWGVYEPNLLAYATFSWNPNISAESLLLDYVDHRFEGAAEHAERALSLIEQAMGKFARPGEAYPDEEGLKVAIDLVDRAKAELRGGMLLKPSKEVVKALSLWGVNLEYTRRDLEAALLSLSARKAWLEGRGEEALSALRRAIELDEGTIKLVASEVARGAVLPSEQYLLEPLRARLEANRRVLVEWEQRMSGRS